MAYVHEKFGVRLRSLRSERGLTAENLARVTDQSTSLINKLEQGVASPSFGNLVKLAATLGIDPVYMLVFPEDNPLHALIELTRGASRSTVRTMLRACTEIAEQSAERKRAVGE